MINFTSVENDEDQKKYDAELIERGFVNIDSYYNLKYVDRLSLTSSKSLHKKE